MLSVSNQEVISEAAEGTDSRDMWVRGWLCLQDLEKQYKPSRWSPKGEPEEVIMRHIDSATAGNNVDCI